MKFRIKYDYGKDKVQSNLSFRKSSVEKSVRKIMYRRCEGIKDFRRIEKRQDYSGNSRKRRNDKDGKVREMTLMSLANKVCATMLTNRLNKEEKEENYTRMGASGFRWYLCLNLNYLVEKELKESRKVVAT